MQNQNFTNIITKMLRNSGTVTKENENIYTKIYIYIYIYIKKKDRNLFDDLDINIIVT